jgi:proteasome lid subunit RPN8/RPN11
MPEELRLTRAQLDSIVRHARSHKPLEACGILAGDPDGTVRQVFLMENAEHSPTLYMMDSREQFHVFDEIERKEMELVAIFHSHPHSPAVPSARDCELAFYPDALYLIISLVDDSPEWHAYRILDGKVSEVEVTVDGGAE